MFESNFFKKMLEPYDALFTEMNATLEDATCSISYNLIQDLESKKYYLQMILPNVKKENVEITTLGKDVMVKYTAPKTADVSKKYRVCIGKFGGVKSFEKKFTFDSHVQSANATLERGILTVEISTQTVFDVNNAVKVEIK